MKREVRLYLFVVCAIVLFDVVASFASRALKFDYTHLVWVSRFWYAVAGYFGFAYAVSRELSWPALSPVLPMRRSDGPYRLQSDPI